MYELYVDGTSVYRVVLSSTKATTRYTTLWSGKGMHARLMRSRVHVHICRVHVHARPDRKGCIRAHLDRKSVQRLC